MALDEVLWQSATTPRLRFYRWDHPALSFGYFGPYSDVAQYQDERELVRRCTGGGVVFHGSDLTYALIIPANEQRREISPMTVYARVHQAMQRALRDVGIEAGLVLIEKCRDLAVPRATVGSNRHVDRRVADIAAPTAACFANPVTHDVMVNGRKVAGAAQRRSRRGLLQQGSIQNVAVPNEFLQRFIARLCDRPVIGTMDSTVLRQAEQLADDKYATDDWLHRV